jgi:hypothetical protein
MADAGHLDDDEARELLEALSTTELLFGATEAWITDADVQAGAVESSLVVVQAEALTWTKRIWPERWEVRCRFSLDLQAQQADRRPSRAHTRPRPPISPKWPTSSKTASPKPTHRRQSRSCAS